MTHSKSCERVKYENHSIIMVLLVNVQLILLLLQKKIEIIDGFL